MGARGGKAVPQSCTQMFRVALYRINASACLRRQKGFNLKNQLSFLADSLI